MRRNRRTIMSLSIKAICNKWHSTPAYQIREINIALWMGGH